ncbi:hypothetical protein LNJ06_00530 [Tenacibaculum finnmarkense genomovar ulcerans]|uniref:hypothetical protein n=1 Tax=Tenacibaculum finnmarkense TaxID=2781243 RepID=UPI001E4F91A8|nr:hypothetical protein [Tenacibaculum finnmarkense]MCD8405220.1 hypothetical protein [Tenacibaculum dicentrarchi]MCD8428674.1 hypothetical protein [Tenacibaculum finnmarkense genomovar ulcerans]MCG8732467.1 hypothetical protein [Tenacibaculum finnmarkense]
MGQLMGFALKIFWWVALFLIALTSFQISILIFKWSGNFLFFNSGFSIKIAVISTAIIVRVLFVISNFIYLRKIKGYKKFKSFYLTCVIDVFLIALFIPVLAIRKIVVWVLFLKNSENFMEDKLKKTQIIEDVKGDLENLYGVVDGNTLNMDLVVVLAIYSVFIMLFVWYVKRKINNLK